MQRVLSTVQFLWVLGQALVDGLTEWLLTFTRHHRAMSDVLRAERYLYTRELVKVSVHAPHPLCLPCTTPPHRRNCGPEPLCALQGRQVRRSLVDQLYTREAEAAPPGSLGARDAPSTASR